MRAATRFGRRRSVGASAAAAIGVAPVALAVAAARLSTVAGLAVIAATAAVLQQTLP